MEKIDLVMKIMFTIGIATLIMQLFKKLEYIFENTERAANALEYIASRLDQESANNALDKIKKDLNSR